MTGERLYQLYCAERFEWFDPEKEKDGAVSLSLDDEGRDEVPPAWPYLKRVESNMWCALANALEEVS